MTRRGRRVQDVVGGTAAAVLVFGAVPTVLVAMVGLPVPRRWDREALLSWHGAFDLLAVAAWVAWIACAWPLLRSVVSSVRRRDTTVPAGARCMDRVAVRIAGAILALMPVTLATSSVAGAAASRAVGAAPSAVAASAAELPKATASPAPGSPAPGSPAPGSPAPGSPTTGSPTTAAARTYTVETGDSLWSIAQHLYGDGAAWPAIAAANLGRVMDDGLRFVDPGLIRRGWRLTIPSLSGPPAPSRATESGSSPPGPSEAASADPQPARTATPAASAGGSPSVSTTGTPAPAGANDVTTTGSRSHARPPASSSPAGSGSADQSRPASALSGPEPSPRRHDPSPAPSGRSVPLADLAALGFGVLVAGLIARRARRAHRLRSLWRAEGDAEPAPSAAAADVGCALAPFADVPVLAAIETANRHLAAALAAEDRIGKTPPARLVRAGPDGVEVLLAATPSWVPPGWVRSRPSAWLLPSRADPGATSAVAGAHGPWLPVLLPVGENDEGTWLVPLRPGAFLPVIGPDAGALVAAMRVAQESWTWSEHVVVTDDPSLAEAGSRDVMATVDPGGHAGTGLLFFGDPRVLGTASRERCAAVTTLALQASDLTVVVDAAGATVHPLGITIRPHLLEHDRAGAVSALLAPQGPAATTVALDADQARSRPVGTVRAAARARPPASPRSHEAPGHAVATRNEAVRPHPAGAVNVRLLTTVPRIDGLSGELAPKRARRAVELVAYLALHHPQPVTGDRLRTRVLGSADADAAAKTLFNTAGAARRALGGDTGGHALFPPASRAGHYRLSELVTVDVRQVEELVGAATGAADDGEAMPLLHEALRLVEAEPMSGVLAGYGWWSAEGHERRTADLAVDAACRLARAASATGDLDLARWAVERARLVEPYSEALVRAAMEVAAASGDARRLQREWAECMRLVDEIDPGGVPSVVTERLYGQLRRRLSDGSSAVAVGGARRG